MITFLLYSLTKNTNRNCMYRKSDRKMLDEMTPRRKIDGFQNLFVYKRKSFLSLSRNKVRRSQSQTTV